MTGKRRKPKAPVPAQIKPDAPGRPPVDPDVSPLHRKHWVQFGWALFIAAVAGGAGIAWQRYQGPGEVVLLNQDTTTRVVVIQDSAQRELMTRMIEELRSLRLSSGNTPPALLNRQATASLPPVAANPIQTPEFRLPGAKGYVGRDLGVFAVARCGPTDYRAGSDVPVELTLRVPGDTARLSPIFVRIARRESPTGGVQLFEQQYRLLPRSLVIFPAPPTPGRYDLEFGVYLIPESKATYPPFYRRECKLNILPLAT